jgi:hypothetical protein
MRLLTGALDIFTCEPHLDLLANRSWNEAYCTARPGLAYAVFFPDGGDVWLDVSAAQGQPLAVRWLDIRQSKWVGEATSVTAEDDHLRLLTPTEEGYWAVLVKVGRS